MLRDAWHGPRAPLPAPRTLAEAIGSYLAHEPRAAGTQAMLRRILLYYGDAPLPTIDQESVDRARVAVLRPDASPATVRRNLIAPLRAVLQHAHRRGWCEVPRFDIPAEPKGRTLFLLPAQVESLIASAAPHLAPLIRFLVTTGCRMSEALALEWPDVDLVAGRAILWEGETKSGGRRVVDLPPAALSLPLPGRPGRVFLTRTGAPYRDSSVYGGQVKTAWATATRGAGLDGFTPHHLRHTWATWHYALHRDLLALKHAGGWSSVTLVERYAHIMPAGHEPGIRRVLGHATGTGLENRR
jgi:integrase